MNYFVIMQLKLLL